MLRKAGYDTGLIGKWGVAAHGSPQEYFQRCATAFDYWAGDTNQPRENHSNSCVHSGRRAICPGRSMRFRIWNPELAAPGLVITGTRVLRRSGTVATQLRACRFP
jgi:hypothetical protein